MFLLSLIVLRIIMAVDNDTTVFMLGTNVSVMVMIFMVSFVMSGDSNGLLDGVFFKIGHYFTTSNSILIISEIIILSVLFMGISSRLLMKQKVT